MNDITTLHSFRCDLNLGPLEAKLNTPLMHQDALADTFRVAVCRDMKPVDLTGMTVSGYLYFSATQQALPLSGTVSGHYASVTLTDSCYAIPGWCSLVIQLQQGDVRHTVLKVDFAIQRTGGDTYIAPGSPTTLAELLARIEALEKSGGGGSGSVTADSISKALGYTPADVKTVQQITEHVIITSGTAGEKAENVFKDSAPGWTDSLYVDYENGNAATHAAYTGSANFIALPVGGRIFARYTNAILTYPTVAFYDSGYNFIRGEWPRLSSTNERDAYQGMQGYFYPVPANAKYFRASCNTNFIENVEIYVIGSAESGASVKIPNLAIPKSLVDGKTVVCFGDSLFGMYRGEDSAPAFIAQETGATVHNVGFGGCRMSVHPTSGYSAFSMWALAKAIAENKWTDQDAQASSGSDYFPEHLALLKSIDFNKVDMAVIHYGTNDFAAGGSGISIDNAADPDDYTTLCGALRFSIEKLLGKYPHLRIFVSLPCFRFWTGSDGAVAYSDTYVNSNGKRLPEFVEALRGVAAEYNLPVIDSYYGLGVNKANAATFLSDGTHHNAAGRERFGRYIGANLVAQHSSGQSGTNMSAVQGLIDSSIGAAIGGSY